MGEAQSIIKSAVGRRGRGPGSILFEDGNSVSSFDPNLLRLAQANIGSPATYTYEEKPSTKEEGRIYKNLVSLSIVEKDGPNKGVIVIEEKAEAIVVQSRPGLPGYNIRGVDVASLTPLEQLKQNFELAIAQRELLENFIKSKFVEGVHFTDGKMFGSKKPVLLQPGAQLIFLAHGYSWNPEIINGPNEAPKIYNENYTITIKCEVKDRYGRSVGSALGSASSLIYSRERGLVPRAVDPDKTFNTTIKIAVKRAMVSACRDVTAAGEFTVDLEEFPVKEQVKEQERKGGGFIKSQVAPEYIEEEQQKEE